MAEAEGSIVISTDVGLEMFGKPAAGVDELGIPHNLMVGTEYVVLDETQTRQYSNGEVEITKGKPRLYGIGAFVLTFSNPNSQIFSQAKIG